MQRRSLVAGIGAIAFGVVGVALVLIEWRQAPQAVSAPA
jgi:hypothetical protein